VLAADAAEEVGLPLARLDPATTARIKRLVPESAGTNPVDPTPFAVVGGHLGQVLSDVADDPDVGYLVYLDGGVLKGGHANAGKVRSALLSLEGRLPLIVDAEMPDELRDELLTHGMAVTNIRDHLWAALRRAVEQSPAATDRGAVHDNVRSEARPDSLVGEYDAMVELTAAGIPMLETIAITDEAELRRACDLIEGPMVLKGLVPGVTHKTGRNLVKIGISGHDEALASWRELREATQDDAGSRVVVQRHVQGGLAEVILGAVEHARYGMHVMLGEGGLWTEIHEDRVWRRAPVDDETAWAMIRSLKLGRALSGDVRKGIAGDARGLASAIVAFSRWAVEQRGRITECEINPLVVTRDSVVGVDAVIKLAAAY
jgi:acyl-CoA synthetase (NDP forming)